MKQKEILELAMLGVIYMQEREEVVDKVQELDYKLLTLTHLLYLEELQETAK